jgi:hypothetical protein
MPELLPMKTAEPGGCVHQSMQRPEAILLFKKKKAEPVLHDYSKSQMALSITVSELVH